MRKIDSLIKLGELINTYRKKKKLEVHELAGISGISKQVLYKYEKGQVEPSASNLIRLVNVLEIPWEETSQAFEGSFSVEKKPSLVDRISKVEVALKNAGISFA